MHIHLCIGWLESRDGTFLGLRDFIHAQVLPRFPGTTTCFDSWRDPVARHVAAHARAGEPLIFLGHSYGASALFRAARQLAGVSIDHFIMLDPVPRWLWGQFQWSCYHLPGNVRAATCLYNPISLPKSSPIRASRGGGFRNITVSPWHASIPGDSDVQVHILEIIRATFEGRCRTAGPGGEHEPVKVPPVVAKGL
jgi:pimeloyl-ACP methyl ester carboxylesterase